MAVAAKDSTRCPSVWQWCVGIKPCLVTDDGGKTQEFVVVRNGPCFTRLRRGLCRNRPVLASIVAQKKRHHMSDALGSNRAEIILKTGVAGKIASDHFIRGKVRNLGLGPGDVLDGGSQHALE